jgi:hypothetical protein
MAASPVVKPRRSPSSQSAHEADRALTTAVAIGEAFLFSIPGVTRSVDER